MKNYSEALSNQRRIEFRKANKAGKDSLKGTHYLVLKNADKLNESQSEKLQKLLILTPIHYERKVTGFMGITNR
ncbi:MAG: hypothetical protein ACJAUP_000128 [Cellvibrionaceae bacterium]|jgi:hypothetical protein